jgi:hypothetical protein
MRGNTATISVQAFRADWLTHVPISELCVRYTVSKDQVIRLRDVWSLPLRNDRSLRFKPKRMPPPDAAEVAASRAGLSLAPAVAAAVTAIQASWTHDDWHSRRVRKSYGLGGIRVLSLSREAQDAVRRMMDD